MRNLLVLLTLSLLFVSCGQVIQEGVRNVDPELEEYVQAFEKYSHKPVNYTVKFVNDIPSNKRGFILGQCRNGKTIRKQPFKRERVKINKVVTINLKTWNSFLKDNEERRALLIFHELFHCSYDSMGHDDSMVNGCPASAMHSELPYDNCVKQVGFDKYIKTMLPLAPTLTPNNWQELRRYL